jgi:hypothetical protein
MTNYVTHAFTVVRFPGERKRDIFLRRVQSLFAPYIGCYLGFSKIEKALDLDRRDDQLRDACREGAIVHLARNKDWRPEAGDRVFAQVVNKKPGSLQRG